jgi:hypothetical protein
MFSVFTPKGLHSIARGPRAIARATPGAIRGDELCDAIADTLTFPGWRTLSGADPGLSDTTPSA